MQNLIELLKNQLGEQGIETLSQKVGANPQQVSIAIEGIVPTLLGAMTRNAASTQGASGLLAALDRDHDGSILDDIQGFLGSENTQGAGILKHVLGSQRSIAEQRIQQKTGLNPKASAQLFETLAPMVMGALGKEKRNSGGFDAGSLVQMLGGLTGTADKSTSLDLNDILEMFTTEGNKTGRKQNGGGLASMAGGLLRSLFGKR